MATRSSSATRPRRLAPYLQSNLTFDSLKSFAPIAGFTLPLSIVSGNDFPAQTPAELVAALKAKRGIYSFANSGVGTVHRPGFTLFESQAGVSAVHVPYRGASQILPDVIGGQVALGVVSATAALTLAKAGKVKALAIMSNDKLPGAEGVAPLSAAVPGFDAVPRLFLAAPAGRPQSIDDRLSEVAHPRRRGRATRQVPTASDMAALAARFANGGAWPHHNMHLHAGLANRSLVEYHSVAVDVCKLVFDGLIEPVEGMLSLTIEPGLGFAPDRSRMAELAKRPGSRGAGKA